MSKRDSATARMERFRILSAYFSLIRVNGKKAIEKGWQRCCDQKRSFDEIGFKLGENAGIACGPGSGIIVLDEDDQNQFRAVCEANGWELPDTFTVCSREGRYHHYYEYPLDGKCYGNRSFKAAGFDIRGCGGYVVSLFSIHPETGKPYVIEKNLPIASAPQWLLELALKDEGSNE